MTRAADRLIVGGCMPGNMKTVRKLSWYYLIDTGLTGSDLEPEYRPGEHMFVTHRVGSTEAAERDLGFRAAIPWRDGLRSVVEWRQRLAQAR